MNANGDTMINGSGLNPDVYTDQWCTNFSGIPKPLANIFLPMPDDSNKYILFHHTGSESYYNVPTQLYYSIVDISLANGLGAVIQKNQIAIQDTFGLGIAACKHANGRDWWIVMLKDSSDLIYKILLTPQGISSVTTQAVTINQANSAIPVFSPDG